MQYDLQACYTILPVLLYASLQAWKTTVDNCVTSILKSVFITLKDDEENFKVEPACRLLISFGGKSVKHYWEVLLYVTRDITNQPMEKYQDC